MGMLKPFGKPSNVKDFSSSNETILRLSPKALKAPAMENPSHIAEALAGAVLSIDLAALQSNWRSLSAATGGIECGAAIKGNAYGLGVEPVSKALWQAGCKTYFVARPMEGAELRTLLPDAIIYVLDGLFPGQAEFYAIHNLRPALISIEEALEWAAFSNVYGRQLPCAIHVDTGINRLGMTVQEFIATLTKRELNIVLLMSHLACADDPLHALNAQQANSFASIRKMLPDVPASLANSSGIYLGPDYLNDLVRAGIALYGGNPLPGQVNPMKAVATLEGTVLQVRNINPGETIGYSATWTATKPSRIAILGAGYKDGIPRSLSSKSNMGPAQVFLNGQRCPIVGRVSMDMMAIDISGLPEGSVARGARAEIFGPNIPIDEVAAWAGTISYELLTRLGSRYARLYSS